MEEQLISFETAKLAKEKGFGRKMNCNMGYTKKGTVTAMPSFYEAPTQSLLQKWLREKHEIVVQSEVFDRGFLVRAKFCYQWRVYNKSDADDKTFVSSDEWRSYEEALEEGLKIGLNLIKNVKN